VCIIIQFKDYGYGYAWNNPYLVINIGDTVTWSWQPPSGINSVTYRIEQVQDGESYKPIGFTSGPSTAIGSFKYQFNQAGTYYYWSGNVESTEQILFRGIVVVKNSLDKQLQIGVKTNGYQGSTLI
jgi:plastocyanin